MSYPNLNTAKMADLVTFYNENVTEDEQVKGFKTKAVAQQACQALIAKLEGTETEEMVEETSEVLEDNATSLLSQLTAVTSGSKKTSTKNEGVWINVKILFDKGLTNKEVLSEIHEMYGNTNTSYSCIAWYRNKYNKSGAKTDAVHQEKLEMVQAYIGAHQPSEEAIADLCKMMGVTLPGPGDVFEEVPEPDVEDDVSED